MRGARMGVRNKQKSLRNIKQHRFYSTQMLARYRRVFLFYHFPLLILLRRFVMMTIYSSCCLYFFLFFLIIIISSYSS